MEETLRGKLLATAALTSLVSTRVDWGVRPQGSLLPAVVMSTISGIPGMKMTGPTGWTSSRVQIECWARTHKAAKDIADLIGGDTGVLTGLRATIAGHQIRTFIIGRRSDSDSDATGVIHRTSLDVLVWFAL